MGRPWRATIPPDLLWRSLLLFLPISGAISLVLLPMVALYEHSQRQTLQTRVEALLEAGKRKVQVILQEAVADTGVMSALPMMSEPQLLGQPLALVLHQASNEGLHQSLMAVACGGPPWLADETPVQLGEAQAPLHLDVRTVGVREGLVLSFRGISARRLAVQELAASEERFRLLAENASDVVFRASLSGETEWITPSVTPLLGWAPVDLEGQPFADFVHPEDLNLLAQVQVAFKRGERRQCRLRVRRRDGGYHWVGVNARGMVDGTGSMVGLVGSWRDVQAEVESEFELDRRARTDPLTGLLNRQETLEQLERLAHHRRASDRELAVLFCDIDHFKAINDRHGHGGGDQVLQTLGDRLVQSIRRGDLVGRIGGDEPLVVLQAMPSLEAAMAIDTVVARADQAMYEAKSAGRDRVIAIGQPRHPG